MKFYYTLGVSVTFGTSGSFVRSTTSFDDESELGALGVGDGCSATGVDGVWTGTVVVAGGVATGVDGAGGVGGVGMGAGFVVGILGTGGVLGAGTGGTAGEVLPTPGVGSSVGPAGVGGANGAPEGTSTGVGSGGAKDLSCSFTSAFSWSMDSTGIALPESPASFASSLSSKSLIFTGAIVGSLSGWMTRVFSEAGFGVLLCGLIAGETPVVVVGVAKGVGNGWAGAELVTLGVAVFTG